MSAGEPAPATNGAEPGAAAPAEPTQPALPGALTQDPGAPPEPAPPSFEWPGSLPEEYRTDPNFTKYTSLDAFFKGHKNAVGMMGIPSEQIARIPKEGDVSAMREFLAKLPGGIPEEASGYGFGEIELPEGMPRDEEFQNGIAQDLHELGIPAPVAQELFRRYASRAAPSFQAQVHQAEVANTDGFEKIVAEWGTPESKSYRIRYEAARRTARQVWGDDWKEALGQTLMDGTRLENYPPIVNLLAQHGLAVAESDTGEGEASLGGGGGEAMTPNQAQAEVSRMDSDPDTIAILQDRNHPQYEVTVKRRRRLIQIQAGEG